MGVFVDRATSGGHLFNAVDSGLKPPQFSVEFIRGVRAANTRVGSGMATAANGRPDERVTVWPAGCVVLIWNIV